MNWVIPHDIPLPLPAPAGVLLAALLVSFAAHILFVNLMLGGALAVLATEAVGRRRPDWDRVSHAIAETVTVNKSLAVVLGVAPLLSLSVLYTMYLYTANALIGEAWLMVVPLVIAAFLLSYAHKYSWHALEGNKGLHLALAALAAALYLSVPLIFLSTINLMLYPERWREVASFGQALFLPNVLPRYLHFVAASLAASGLFLAWYLPRPSTFAAMHLERLQPGDVRRAFLAVTFTATLAQFLIGPLVFFTLPSRAVSVVLVVLLVLLVLPLAASAAWWLWQETKAVEPGSRYWPIVALVSAIICVMIYARHEVRETAVAPHRALMAAKTATRQAQVKAAQNYLVMPGGLGGRAESAGARLFRQTCGACHAIDTRLVGPSLREVTIAYRGNPEGIVTWALNPGRKRMDYPPMPPQTVPRPDLRQIADYILEAVKQ